MILRLKFCVYDELGRVPIYLWGFEGNLKQLRVWSCAEQKDY